jgi:hypothetical protein
MSTKILANLKIVVLAVIFAAGVSYISAWTGPGSGVTPPNDNVAAPLNVGQSTQAKAGALVLNSGWTDSLGNAIQAATGLEVFGTSSFQGPVQIVDGTQGVGKVLTSDVNGVASWMAPAAAAALLYGNTAFSSPGTYQWTAPPNVNQVKVYAWGAGGGGGGADSGGANAGGNGGGSGALVYGTVSVVPGQQYTITVGAGGTGGQGSFDNQHTCGVAGTASSFGSMVANGGGLSCASDAVEGHTAGMGGSGSGGTVINGNNGNYSTTPVGANGVSAPYGGAGGVSYNLYGGATNVNVNGGSPGAGGAGLTPGHGGSATGKGGTGGDGQVIIYYTLPMN